MSLIYNLFAVIFYCLFNEGLIIMNVQESIYTLWLFLRSGHI